LGEGGSGGGGDERVVNRVRKGKVGSKTKTVGDDGEKEKRGKGRGGQRNKKFHGGEHKENRSAVLRKGETVHKTIWGFGLGQGGPGEKGRTNGLSVLGDSYRG